jgi:hypothetical protein
MIAFFIGFLTGFNAFFRSRYNLGLEIIAVRQQWLHSSEKTLTLG